MGFPTKVQVISRQASEQWYINFPAALAQACEFVRGEIVEWVIEDKRTLVLKRAVDPNSTVGGDDGYKKKPRRQRSKGVR